MANIFKFTFKHSLLSIPFLVAALFALCAGSYEVLGYMGNWIDWRVEDTYLFSDSVSCYMLAFVIAALPPMLTGREISSGTIRNKLITGTTKTGFFVSNLAVNCIISVIVTLLYFLPTLIFCQKYYNMFKPYMVIFSIGCAALGYILITAISTVITVMNSRIIVSIVASVAVLFVLLLAARWLNNNLSQPKYIGVYDTRIYENEYGRYSEREEVGEEINPFFIADKTQRTLMWAGIHLMPFEMIINGTAILEGHLTSFDTYKEYMEDAKQHIDDCPIIYERDCSLFYAPIYPLCVTVAVSLLGLFLFDRRNIK